MNKFFSQFLLTTTIVSTFFIGEVKAQEINKNQSSITYSAGGFASAIINKPTDFAFKVLTNVKLWPTINKGVTQSIKPENIELKVGSVFFEKISSPIPGISDWTNEWKVEELVPSKKMVISGIDNFTKATIKSRLTYIFTEKENYTTLFERKIEVNIDENFVKQASKQELEALYRFLGSQWEMAEHLKKFVEHYQTK